MLIRVRYELVGGAYFKVREMSNIKWQIQDKNERYIFTINKPNIMKKSKYRQNFYCLLFAKDSYAFWFSFSLAFSRI